MRFLIIRFSSLGDIILATSLVRAIHNSQPDAGIDFMTKPEYAPVFENIREVSSVITDIRASDRYDYLIDLHGSIRSGFVSMISRAGKKYKYDKAAFERRLFLHTKRRTPKLDKNVIERYFDVFRQTGLIISSEASPFLSLTSEEKAGASRSTGGSEYIVVAPFAKWPMKEWGVDNTVGFIKRMIRDEKKRIVLVGGLADIEKSRRLAGEIGVLGKNMLNLTGQTGLRELFAVIGGADLAVTMDSAALHIAYALNRPAIALFGPTVREFGFQFSGSGIYYLQKDMKCRPCSLHGEKMCRFKDKACLGLISPEEVVDLARKIQG